jgi:hypothetical protein
MKGAKIRRRGGRDFRRRLDREVGAGQLRLG